MGFSDRITRVPHVFEPAQGVDAKVLFSAHDPTLRDLIHGVSSGSPFLQALILREATWLQTALDDPEAAFDNLLSKLAHIDEADTAKVLRQAKGQVALLTALADLAGVWSLVDVTTRLTQFADAAVCAALKAALAPELRRGKLPGLDESALDTSGGLFVLAMGKMGAHELNYSSDIDLVCLFDEARFDRDDLPDARAGFVRAVRKMCALLNDRTEDGYVFRTDLRLRPDPQVTPVAMPMGMAENYYESLGRTWERAAFIKARPAAGDLEAGARFLRTLRPFVWRKHLDFAAIEDAHNMRLRIREHKGTRRLDAHLLKLDAHNLKLGQGGIREIEFFTQTRQLISGGRDADLRHRGTCSALAALTSKGWVSGEDQTQLTEHYEFHREIEHRLQMVHDAQTQTLPNSDQEWRRLAALCARSSDDLQSELRDRLEDVDRRTDGFFAPEPNVADLTQIPLDEKVIARWMRYPALRSSRAATIFNRLQPEILNRLGKAADPAGALAAFDGFLAGLPAGVQLLSLFEANPQLIDLLIDIVGTAPDLGGYLSRNAGVFDAVLAGDFFAPWPELGTLTETLKAELTSETDYEARLDAARRWHKEWHFRIGVHLLRGLIDADRAGEQYSQLAEAVLTGLWPVVLDMFAQKHGPAPGRGAAVVAMGALGAGWLNAGSDLDLILIYDAQGQEASEGPRPLPARTYYARLTKALITALSAQMSQGRLYEVDMRLRPSGNQGPVATSLEAFQTYQQNDAWPWEHLALSRARPIAGPLSLQDSVETVRADLMARPRDRGDILQAVSDMRARIAEAKPVQAVLDAKLGPGRLQDIELIAQAGALLSGKGFRNTSHGLDAAKASQWLQSEEFDILHDSLIFCQRLAQATRLISQRDPDTEKIGQRAAQFLARETGLGNLDMVQRALLDKSAQAANVISEVLARETGDTDG